MQMRARRPIHLSLHTVTMMKTPLPTTAKRLIIRWVCGGCVSVLRPRRLGARIAGCGWKAMGSTCKMVGLARQVGSRANCVGPIRSFMRARDETTMVMCQARARTASDLLKY